MGFTCHLLLLSFSPNLPPSLPTRERPSSSGSPHEPGDDHFGCAHANHKIPAAGAEAPPKVDDGVEQEVSAVVEAQDDAQRWRGTAHGPRRVGWLLCPQDDAPDEVRARREEAGE